MAKRAKGRGVVTWGLMAMLVLGLGGFGVTNFGGSVRSIASVGDREIGVNDYARALTTEARALSQQIGQNVGFEQVQALGRDGAVRAGLIAAAAQDNEAGRIGISVGDEQVRVQILAAPEFQGLNGQFDRTAYTEALRQEGLTEVEFETRLRESAARAILQAAIVGGIEAPGVYTDTLTAWATETRSFTDAELIAADLAEPVGDADEAELQAYYDANIADFTSLETRAITYVWLAPETMTDKIEIDETELRAAYDARSAEFVVPERRMVERLIYPSDAEAEAAKARIDAGTSDFADLAAERGLALADLDLGEVSLADLGAAGDAVFALEQPSVVGPLPTDLGPALFSMNAVLEGQEVTFDEARDDIFAEMALDQARRMVLDAAPNIEDLLAGGATLEQVATEAGMELGQIDVDATTQDGIAAYSGFREAALAAQPGDFAQLAELDDGGLFALRLDELRAPAPIPLDEARDDVATAWRAAETQRRLVVLAGELLAKLDAGDTLETLGLVVTRHEDTLRNAFIEGLPDAVTDKAFETAQGEHAVVEAAGVHLIRVDAVTPSDTGNADTARLRDMVDQQAAQGLAGDMLTAFVTALQTEAGVTFNTAAINAVHAQMR